MIKFAIAIAIAIIGANFLANSIDIEPVSGSSLDRAERIEHIASR